MFKTKIEALEDLHNEIQAKAIESEVQIAYFKDKDQDEVILEQPKRSAIGQIVMQKFTAEMVVKEQEGILKRNQGRLEIIEKKIEEEKSKEPKVTASPSGPTG